MMAGPWEGGAALFSTLISRVFMALNTIYVLRLPNVYFQICPLLYTPEPCTSILLLLYYLHEDVNRTLKPPHPLGSTCPTLAGLLSG